MKEIVKFVACCFFNHRYDPDDFADGICSAYIRFQCQ